MSQPTALLLDPRAPVLPQALPDFAELGAQAVAAIMNFSIREHLLTPLQPISLEGVRSRKKTLDLPNRGSAGDVEIPDEF